MYICPIYKEKRNQVGDDKSPTIFLERMNMETNTFIDCNIVLVYKRLFEKFMSLDNEHWVIPVYSKSKFLCDLRTKLRPLLDMTEDQEDDDIYFEIEPRVRDKKFDECILVYYRNSKEANAPEFNIAVLYVSYMCDTAAIRGRVR